MESVKDVLEKNYIEDLKNRIELPKELRWLKDGFTQVSNNILIDNKLTKELRFFYVILLMYGFKKGFCYPSTKTLSKTVGVDQRTIQRYLRALEKAKWIEIEMRAGKTTVYKLLKVN
jgi:DNA-binding transcriptional ArsR family regulator